MNIRVEIVCCGVDDAVASTDGGADRIELCSGLQLGGLTPSVGLLRAVKAATTLPVMAMLRPRPSGFCYSRSEIDVMLRDADILLEAGGDGVVFGCLRPDGSVDEAAVLRIASNCDDRDIVFHRAFDIAPEPLSALEALVGCGVTRVLTSGQSPTAADGAAMIATLRTAAKERIEILPGGGIRAHNVVALLQRTGCDQIHLAPRRPRADPTASGNGINYGADSVVVTSDVREIVSAVAAAR